MTPDAPEHVSGGPRRAALHDLAGRGRGAAARVLRVALSARTPVRRALRRGHVPGLLSIVVPCYDVEEYLGDCLASLRFGDYRDIEILVVDDGSPDDSAGIARAHQRRDLRVRVVRRPNGGLSAARNTGIEHARGEFLTFVDSDDLVAPDAYGRVISTLRSTGSDFAVSLYDRVRLDQHQPAARWIRRAHARARLRTDVDEFPEVMVNAVAWSKVYRRSFWDRAGLRFPEGVEYEDQPVSSAAYAAATSIDVLPWVTVHWRIRQDRSSISQQTATVRNLVAQHEASRSSLAELAARGRDRALALRATQLLAHNMGTFTRHLLTTDDSYWVRLQQAIRELVEQVDEDDYVRGVTASHKVLQHLIAADRREDALAFREQFGNNPDRFVSHVDPDGVRVDLPLADTVPAHCSLLAEAELSLFARVLRTTWRDGALTVSGWAYVRNLDLATLSPRIEVTLRDGSGEALVLATTTFEEIRADEQGRHWHADYRPGGFTAVLDRDHLPRDPGTWTAHLRFTAGPVTRETDLDDVSVAGSAAVPRSWLGDGLRFTTRRSESGVLELAVDRPAAPDPTIGSGPVATAVEIEPETLVVRCVGVPASARAAVPVLGTAELTVGGEAGPGPDATTELRIPLSHAAWGRTGLGLPTGKYAVELRAGRNGRALPVLVAPELLDTLPVEGADRRHHLLVEVFAQQGPRLALTVRQPLAADERGARNQHRLRTLNRVETAEADSVFFRALYGEAANCNMLGVHRELLRRGSGLRLLWSVRDHSVPIPEGGEALIEGSAEWHRAIARSRYHMVNVHQLDWFAKPAGQVIIQTMHGYPYKVMGHEWWAKGDFSGPQIRNYDRRAREWDYFVSPATYATPLLRKAFLDPAGSRAQVLEIGYPRNDVLQGPAAERLRERTRGQLGVRPGQTVVLYAPTFRDYLSSDDMTAAPVDFFDVDGASRRLGGDYVFLMRGHAFNARARARFAPGTRIVDVTTHPDVNELIAASDVAVLDYSSLRFDYAITGRPMIFLVPDLARYDEARGGVLPYPPTAPGPQVRTTREVVAHLRDLPGLARDYAAAIERFRADYVDLDDGHAAARLVDAVFVPRGDAPPA